MEVDPQLHNLLKTVTIFSGIEDRFLDEICSKCSIVKMRKDAILIKESTEATDIFIILSGEIRIVLNMDENPIDLITLGPGNCIGEASVIGVQDHSASVILTKDSEFLVLSRCALMQLCSENKNVFSMLILNIARELARRLHQADHALIHYIDKTNSKKK